jgi:serine O-acetyltransferase
MNREILRLWLKFILREMFGGISSEGMERALAAAEESSALILSDFLRAYPMERWKDKASFERTLQTDAPFQATLLYRMSHVLFLNDPTDDMLDLLSYIMRSRTGIEVYYSSLIGKGFRILHGSGLVLGPRHRIGKNFTVYQNVTLGQRRQHCPEEFLEIGDNCIFFAGARILGKLKIGNDVKVAANAVLLCDAEDGTTYGGVPAKRI